MLRHIQILSLCILLAACTAQSPPRTDPLADLIGNAKIADSPTRVITDAKVKSLALIVSTSSETQIKTLEYWNGRILDYVKTFQSENYNAVKAQQDSVSPRKLIGTVVSELRPRFKNVVVVADLAEFKESNHDVAAVVDVGMESDNSSSPARISAKYTTDVSLILIDRQIRKIGIASGKAIEFGENSGMISNLAEQRLPLVEAEKKSRVSAFRLLNASLDTLVTPNK